MLDFYHQHENVELDIVEARHHLLLGKPATTDHIGRYQKSSVLLRLPWWNVFLAKRCKFWAIRFVTVTVSRSLRRKREPSQKPRGITGKCCRARSERGFAEEGS